MDPPNRSRSDESRGVNSRPGLPLLGGDHHHIISCITMNPVHEEPGARLDCAAMLTQRVLLLLLLGSVHHAVTQSPSSPPAQPSSSGTEGEEAVSSEGTAATAGEEGEGGVTAGGATTPALPPSPPSGDVYQFVFNSVRGGNTTTALSIAEVQFYDANGNVVRDQEPALALGTCHPTAELARNARCPA